MPKVVKPFCEYCRARIQARLRREWSRPKRGTQGGSGTLETPWDRAAVRRPDHLNRASLRHVPVVEECLVGDPFSFTRHTTGMRHCVSIERAIQPSGMCGPSCQVLPKPTIRRWMRPRLSTTATVTGSRSWYRHRRPTRAQAGSRRPPLHFHRHRHRSRCSRVGSRSSWSLAFSLTDPLVTEIVQ